MHEEPDMSGQVGGSREREREQNDGVTITQDVVVDRNESTYLKFHAMVPLWGRKVISG